MRQSDFEYLIIILVTDNHNKNPAMLAIKDLNNIIWFGKPQSFNIIMKNPAKFGYLKIQIPYLLTSKSEALDTRWLLANGDLICLHCKPEFYNTAAYSL